MIVQEYTDSDFEQLRRLHEGTGFDYSLPTFSSKEFLSRRVIKEDNRIAMGTFLRLTAEAYLICDPTWRNPAWRYDAFRALSKAGCDDARAAGVHEINAFLPPEVTKTFGKRLTRLGWNTYKGPEWKCFSLPLRST